MPDFDPDYLAAIEREQVRLIDEELARLRARPRAQGWKPTPWAHRDKAVVNAALIDAAREHERAEWERQRETWPDYAAKWLQRIESMGEPT